MTDDYVTRKELADVERDLRQGILETERILRRELTGLLHDFKREIKDDLASIEEHLSEQDKLLQQRVRDRSMWWRSVRLAVISVVAGAIASGIMYTILHAVGVLG